MLGHKWEPAQGTIVQARSGPASGHGHGAASHREHHYVIEVRKPTGEVIRGNVTEKNILAHAVGTTIGVEVHSKTGEVRIDPSARTDSVRTMVDMAQQMRGGQDPAGAGGMPGAGRAGGLGASASGGDVLRVLGPDGQELPIHMESGEIGKLAEALRSGDPAARQAAMERLRELRDRARNRTAHEVAGPKPAAEGFSGSSGPGSSDDIGGPGTQATPEDAFGEPAGFSSFHEPAGFSPVGQPAAPGPRAPTPSTFSAFDTSGGQGSVEERLARLKQLLDKGIVTESEFQAQRQQIINGT